MIPIEIYQYTIREFLAPIASFLDDPKVTEIMINGHDEIYVERAGKLSLTRSRFLPHELISAINNIAQFQGVTLDAMNPILEARLPDGSRVEAILPPAAIDGPHVSIRRFSRDTLTIDKLIQFNALTTDVADILHVFVEAKRNIIVAGGTNSGKTSLLNAISSFIPKGERVVVLEDAKELQLQGNHIVHLEAQKPDPQGGGQVTMSDLFKATLRMRPDRIVVGEIRGAEAIELIQAMTSGHGGCMSTLHATYPTDTLNRLETMARMSNVALPLYALRSQIASAIDIIVQTSRLRDGSRCITHVTEVQELTAENAYQTKDLFVRQYSGLHPDGHVKSDLVFTGIIPQCADAIHHHGLSLPDTLYASVSRRPIGE